MKRVLFLMVFILCGCSASEHAALVCDGKIIVRDKWLVIYQYQSGSYLVKDNFDDGGTTYMPIPGQACRVAYEQEKTH